MNYDVQSERGQVAPEKSQALREQFTLFLTPLLTELGAYLLSPDKVPAGTKRLSNPLHSDKWKAKQDTALLLWGESVIEKPKRHTVSNNSLAWGRRCEVGCCALFAIEQERGAKKFWLLCNS